jgi:UDP-N-acetylmuramoyl-L-alanyl-D-glutamate--2,6-diaminopimelate ligase
MQASGTFNVALPGEFNIANAAIAAVCTAHLGYSTEAISDGLADASSIPGRFEVVSGDDPITVIVDYAHTPAGIEKMIAATRALVAGRVICVFGAGGDRDRTKRPDMGRAAAAADLVFVTSDNPRSEDPAAIIDQVMQGVPDQVAVERLVDRSEAIERAISVADEGDAVLILGKGHERGQEFVDRVVPFDDRLAGVAALERRRRTQ